jgi:hypothetical protein
MIARAGIVAGGRRRAEAGSPSYDGMETFEGSQAANQGPANYDNTGWTVSSASVLPNFATPPAPLEGSYSYRPGNAARTLVRSVTNVRSVYFRLHMDSGATAAGNSVFRLRNGSTVLATIETTTTDFRLRVSHGTSNSDPTPAGLSLSAEHHFWLDYIPGSGANGVTQLYHATTATKPASPLVQVTNGTATLECDTLQVGGFGGTAIFDRIVWHSSAIGSNP